jgi:hypothetical protein
MKKFEEVTDQILAVDFSQPADSLIERIQVLLDKRSDIMSDYDALCEDNTVENDYLNMLIQKNLMVETKLDEIMLTIKDNVKSVVKEKSLSSKKKKAHRGYLNPGHQTDGYFIDKKK